MAGAHQDMAAVLEQGVHRHHEEAREGADDHQQRYRQPHVAHEDHEDHAQAHGDAERDDAHRFAQRDHPGGQRGADGDADGDDALQHAGLG